MSLANRDEASSSSDANTTSGTDLALVREIERARRNGFGLDDLVRGAIQPALDSAVVSDSAWLVASQVLRAGKDGQVHVGSSREALLV